MGEDFEIIVSLDEMIQQDASAAKFLPDGDDHQDISRKWKRVGPGKGNPLLGVKSNYVRREGVAGAFYKSVSESHDPIMWEAFTSTKEQ